jgi:TRAP-type C4-dicarboxylate transport system substrate-binding protein
MVGEALEFWNELSEAERAEMREAQRKADQEMLLQSEQDWIDTNTSLIETLKEMIGRRVRKEDYTDKDQEIVELALGIIKACERDIKIAEREILLLAKYPVGSKQRPSLILRKEYYK